MKYLSLFSGIGGFELGIQRALDVPITERDKPRGVDSTANIADTKQEQMAVQQFCVGYSEIDQYAIKVYERHFNHENYGNATKIEPRQLPDFDLVVGGFPCQAFSVAGKRRGFDDTRGTLFFDIARILKYKRPRHLLLENVKGLLSHDSGKTFQTILGVLSDLGYRVEWQLLNSKDFGVPQNRERVFIIGHLRGECTEQVFPISRVNPVHLKEITSNLSDAQRIYTTDQAKTLKGLGGGMGAKTGLYSLGDIKEMAIRRLIPKECERLQGFPDNWTQLDDTGREISDTQRYKMCGNAVTVNVVQAVIEKMELCLTTKPR